MALDYIDKSEDTLINGMRFLRCCIGAVMYNFYADIFGVLYWLLNNDRR